jgi:hypothetical protein
LPLVGCAIHVAHSATSGASNIGAHFFMLGWDCYGFNKNHTETRYAKLVFLHPVGSVGHVKLLVCLGHETLLHKFSCPSGTGTDSTKIAPGHMMPNLCFCIRCDL